jgi:SAM-dependent methyltransferase
MTPYTSNFFVEQSEFARRSAEEVVPAILELTGAKRIVDIGCGDGTWLSIFRANGVNSVLGIDGDYVDRGLLKIPSDCFMAHDLTQPLALSQAFDLATSLEVAEHLSEPHAAGFVNLLTQLAPVILFSAAIPWQQGVSHLNEKWPAYWIQLFRARGYVARGCLRSRFWDNSKVGWWYTQNMRLFVREDSLGLYPALQAGVHDRWPQPPDAIVHPRMLTSLQALYDPEFVSLRRAGYLFWKAIVAFLRRKTSPRSRS